MKATRRRDGRYRYTVRVEHHFGFDDIVAIVTNHMVSYGDPLPGARQEAITMVRRHLLTNGEPGCGLLDIVNERQVYYVAEKLAPLFPDLHPDPLGTPPTNYDAREVEESLNGRE